MRRNSVLGLALVAAGCFSPSDVDLPNSDTDPDPTGTTSEGTPLETDDEAETGSDSDASIPMEETGATEPPPDCVDDEDCDDGLACNGEETCDAGSCADGVPACDNPEPEHCVVRCEESDGGPECEVSAADMDGDSVGDAACTAAPGLDCDDTNDAVHPAMEELCDGIDNDCNGLADLDDGLTLFGTPTIVPGANTADLAYAPEEETYAIAFYDFPDAMFASYHADQIERAAPEPIAPGASGRLFVEWGGSHFRTFYTAGSAFPNFFGLPIDPDGDSAAPVAVATMGGLVGDYGVGRRPDGGWGVVYRQTDLVVQLLGSDGAAAGDAQHFEMDSLRRTPRFAQVDDTFALAWEDESTRIAFFDEDFDEVDEVHVTAGPPGHIYGKFGLGPMGDGFAIAYNRGGAAQRIDYAEYDADGMRTCGPITLADSSEPYIQNMATHDGVAAVYLVQGDAWELYRVREGCEAVGEGVTIETVTFFGEMGDVEINETGIGVVSQIYDDGGANPRLSFRTFGPNLCDASVTDRR